MDLREQIRGARRGIEKESLRVDPDGTLAQTPHPKALGSALMHPHITTDFSESQLELITGPQPTVDACLEELQRIHQVVYRAIGDEVMWGASMPCNLPADQQIPIGRYGTSNVGRAKTVYRLGLSHRYGRRMQAISGIHYNFSLPGVSDEQYFGLIRNFRRESWLLLYLFGASPAVCSSFVAGKQHELKELEAGGKGVTTGTHYSPHATSLRMGRLGYQSEAQASLCVSYNNLKDYTASLFDALTKPYPEYEKIGIRSGDDYRQLSTTLLQIENEFYSTIRPKRRIRRGERPLHALRERGVEYVEVRLMDLDPFAPIGITPSTCRFLDLFLLQCLLAPSAPDTGQEIREIGSNQQRVALRGREPGLLLDLQGKTTPLKTWAGEILAEIEPLAARVDAELGGAAYRAALDEMKARLEDPGLTPSARVLSAMARNHQDSFVRFALVESTLHKGTLKGLELAKEAREHFARLADESLMKQRDLEASDELGFEAFRQRYLAADQLKV